MARRYRLSSMLVFLCLVFCASAAWAQWVKDGVPVGSSNGNQFSPRIIPDGANGAMLVWTDSRSGFGLDIYGNRVTGDGIVLGGSGIPLCAASGDQYLYDVMFDEAGYGIAVWLDYRDGGQQIYAQRVDTMGNVYWPTDGLNICPSAVIPYDPAVISDGAGGAIIAWNDSRNGNHDIFAQRVDQAGNLLWGDYGVTVCVYSTDQYAPKMVADGAGGAIVVWTDYRNSDSDIFAQRIDGDGNPLWVTDGISICGMGNAQYLPRIIADSGGGAYVLWTDNRNGYEDTYVQRIDSDGAPVWPVDGIPVCDDAGSWNYKNFPALVDDGAGGVIIAWADGRSGATFEVYGQRFDPDGTRAWGTMGKKLIPCYNYGDEIRVATDGSGGAVVVAAIYLDDDSPTDVYAQRVDHDGTLLWGKRGAAVCADEEYQYTAVMIPDGIGGVIVAWEDQRPETSGDSDIYGQRMGASGLWGTPEPVIISCLDVPEDQGGWVRIATKASSHDVAGETESPIFGYNVWRMIESGGGPLAASTSAPASDRARVLTLLSDPATAKGVRLGGADAIALGLPEGDWESVGFWFATRDTVYNIAVPTKNDSTEAGTPWETFIVTAHTLAAGVFVASEPSTGYSVDNLAPGMTGGLAGEQIAVPAGLRLTWDRNAASDMWKYNVHRGDRGTFEPDGSNLIGTTTELALHDPTWASFYNYFYKLVAVDRHGNLSPAALLRPEDVKVGTMLQSFAASLKDAGVEISWMLSEAGAGARFRVLRAADGGGFSELVNVAIERNGLSFTCVDGACEPGTTYRYRVDVADEGGQRVLFETDAISTPSMALTLYQNHPNPFNPATVISFYVPATTQVTLDIYDSSGRLAARLLDQAQKAKGTYRLEWRGVDAQGRSVSSGVYFYRLQAGRETISKKMVLVR